MKCNLCGMAGCKEIENRTGNNKLILGEINENVELFMLL